MKKTGYVYNKVLKWLVFFLPFYLFTFLPSTVSAKKQKQLVILHTNDTHSTILPVSSQIDTMRNDRGGFLRRIAMLREERAKNPGLLLFDSGDFSQGSAYYTMFKGDGLRCRDHRQPRVRLRT